MNILKSISAAFNRLWRWITETAWVQPLLIVGGLFAIIFSISKFVNWFSVMAVGTNSGYFNSYRLSLENEGKAEFDTEADKMTHTINDFSFDSDDFSTYEEALAALNERKVIEDYGVKYFFVIVENDCNPCDEAKNAFEKLESGWNNANFKIDDGNKYRLHTINADEESTNDPDFKDVTEDQKAFSRYVHKFDDLDLWARAAGKLEQAPYKLNKSVSSTKYEAIENAASGEWETPTIFLVDWTEPAWREGRFGLSEVLFGLSGDSDYDKATLLQQMWNHVPQERTEAYADTDNPFRDATTGW